MAELRFVIAVADMPGFWQVATVLALILAGVAVLLIPSRVANRLAGGTLSRELKEIGSAASTASERIQTLNDELAAAEELGRWRSIMQTALGTVVGLAGGVCVTWFGKGWGSITAQEVVGVAVVLVVAVVAVFVASTRIFPRIDKEIRERLEGSSQALEQKQGSV